MSETKKEKPKTIPQNKREIANSKTKIVPKDSTAEYKK